MFHAPLALLVVDLVFFVLDHEVVFDQIALGAVDVVYGVVGVGGVVVVIVCEMSSWCWNLSLNLNLNLNWNCEFVGYAHHSICDVDEAAYHLVCFHFHQMVFADQLIDYYLVTCLCWRNLDVD